MRLIPALAVAVSLAGAPSVHAAEKKADRRAKQLFEEGQRAYDLADFQTAVDKYKAAYKEKPLPAFLFNVAQCYRQLKQWDQASFFYRRYLTLAPNAPNVDHVKDLLAEVEKQAKAAAPPPAPTVPPATADADTQHPVELEKAKAEAAERPVEAAKAPPPPPAVASAAPPPPPAVAPPKANSGGWSEVPLAAAPAPSVAETRTVTADPDAVHVVAAGPAGETERREESKAVYGQWWFWTAVGVAAVAVAATAVYFGTQGSSGAANPCASYTGGWCINLR